METDQVAEETDGRGKYDGVLRYYELAKKQEWQVRDLPWADQPPIPEYTGAPAKLARRRDLWRSVIMQQLQADMFACEMASQLLNAAPHIEAKLYYSTMVQDESRHTEAWLRLAEEAGGVAERDPHLDQLAAMFLDLDTLEEKVFGMQVFFERMIIPRFRMIAAGSRGTVLENLCNRLTVDDGIHHSAGMAYERVLLEVVAEHLDVAIPHQPRDRRACFRPPERVRDEDRQKPVGHLHELLALLLGRVLEQHPLVGHARAVVDAVVDGQAVAQVLEHGPA